MATRVQVRRNTAAQWVLDNPVLAPGEPGLETDTGYLKWGDGVTQWTSLGYQKINSAGLPSIAVTDSSATPKGIDSTGTVAGSGLQYDSTSGKFKVSTTLAKISVGSTSLSEVYAPGPTGGDDYSTIQPLVASGVRVKLQPNSTYQFATAIPVPAWAEVQGCGRATRLRATGNNYIFAPTSSFNRISDLMLDATNVQTAGGGIDFTNAATNIGCERLYLGNGLFIGLNVAPLNGSRYFFDQIRWEGWATAGVQSCNTGMLVGDGTHQTVEIYCNKLTGVAVTSGGMSNSWIQLNRSTDTVHIFNSLFVIGTNGIRAGVTGSGLVTGVKLNGVVFDTMTNIGADIANCRDFQLDGTGEQTCGTGINLQATATGVRKKGGIVQNCGANGIVINNGAIHTQISDVLIAGNNTGNSAFVSGISVAAGASEFTITNNRIMNTLNGLAGHQKNGVLVATGASDYYVITGNRCPTDTDQTVGVNDLGTGTHKLVSNI